MTGLTRRQVLYGSAAGLLVLSAGRTAMAQGTGAVTRGGTVVVADLLAIDSLDPHVSTARSLRNFSLIYDSLFSYRPKPGSEESELGPALATGYEVTGDNTARMRLRDDVTFHDGSKLDAGVVKWNLERAKNHGKSSVKASVARLKSITVVDDLTLDLEFDSPQPLFQLTMIAQNQTNVFMLSRQAVEAAGDDAFGRAPVGSGPYKVDRWLVDDRVELSAVDGHWELGVDGRPLPYADHMIVRLMTDQSVSALELRAGNVHMTDPLEQDIDSLERDGMVLAADPGSSTGQPSFYITSRKDSASPWASDVRLRRALQHAINREAMAEVLSFGRGAAQYYWGWYPGVPGYDESLPRYEFDPDKARALLAEAGYANGIGLTVKVINRPKDVQPLEMMQAMLADVGINLTIETMDRTPWVDAGRSGNFEALSHGNTALVDPLFRRESNTGSNSNWAGYSSPDVDALWEEASRTADRDARAEIYKKMQVIIHNDAYHVIGFRVPKLLALSPRLGGFESDYNLRYFWLRG